MADKTYKNVVLKDPKTGVILYPEVNVEIPTVNDKTVTIKKNGTAVDSFTLNQATDKDINITVPTKTSDLTNDSEFLVEGDLTDYAKKTDIPTVNNKTITISKNGTAVDSFTLNQSTNKTISITVPTTAADVSALPASTKYAASAVLSIDPDTYVMSLQLKDQNGTNLGTAQTIDLPLETMVVSGSYNTTTKKIVLTLQGGSTVEFSVADLISGLQTEITSTNKLSADLIANGTTNKVVTATEKAAWNNKQDSINDLNDIRANAQAGADAASTISGYGDVVSHDADEFASADHTHTPASIGAAASTHTHTKSQITDFPTIPTVNNTEIEIQKNSTKVGSFTTNQSGSKKTINITVPTTASDVGAAEASHTHTKSQITDFPTIPTITDTYSASSSNGMSGKAVASAISGITPASIGALPADTVIPAAVTESTVSGWGFTKNAGTITGIKMNGASKGTSGVVDLGTVLTSHQTVKVNGVTGATTNNFGTCSTAAGTAAKTVSLTAGTFTLEAGARVLVKFTVTNTAANPTLNVGGTGAKAIQYRGSAISASYLAANRTYAFVYDGTNYQLVGDINTDTNNATAQNISTANDTYPILLGNTANATANIGNKATLFGSGIKANPSTSTIVATTFDGNATSATTASKLGTADVGSATQGIYLDNGVAKACTYTVAKSVPSDAKFTDTVYTHPTTAGNKHVPSGGSANQVLVYSSDGTAVWGALPSHTHSEYFAKNSAISGATDWNTLTTFGCYKIQNTTMTAEYNAPAGEYAYGLLLVYRIGTDNENRVGQTYYPHQPNSGAVLWARMQNGTNWTAWKKVQQSQISKGSATHPVYFDANGNATACTYELNKTVPSDAKFTDTVYTHPTTAGNKHIPSGGSSNQVLVYGGSSGTASWGAVPSHTHAEYSNKDTMRSTEFIVGTQTATTGSWTGVTEDTTLYDGKNINYFLPYAGSGNASLNLTLAGGGTTGAKPIYLSGTSYVTTHYGANSCINMTYNATKGAWFVDADRDNNDVTRLQWSNNITAATAITANRVIVGTSSGYKNIAANTTFDITYPILYSKSAINAAATGTNNWQSEPAVNLANNKSGWTGTNLCAVYLVGTLDGTVFTIDSTMLTTTVPTSADNKVYTPLGVMYSTTNCYFRPTNEYYAYVDGKFQKLTYVHPTTAGNKHIPSGGSSGQILKYSASGTAVWANEYSYTHPTTSGNKHIPSGGSSGQYLKWSADGTATWATISIPTITDTYSATSSNGMSGKAVASAIAGIAIPTVVDTYSATGTDAVSGKAVAAALETLSDNDTKNTAGTTNKTGTKMFLAGATSQAANPQTYSNSNVFIDAANTLNCVTPATTLDGDTAANKTKVATVGTVSAMIDALCTQLDAQTTNWS